MAKIKYKDLNLKVNKNVFTLENGIEVKQYLPIDDKIELIERVVNAASDNEKFFNPIKLKIFLEINIIRYYTNINLPDKEVTKLYDELSSSGIITTVLEWLIEETDEYNFIENSVYDTIKNIYTYKNSALGIMDALATDYSSLGLDINELYDKIGDEKNLTLLKDVLTKMG